MKAKLYTLGTTMEVLVSNKSYTSTEGEAKKAFLKRVNAELEKDFDEAIDIVEVDAKSLAKLTDKLLVQAFMSAKGLQEQIIGDILKERNIEVEKIEKTTRNKIEKVDLEVAKASEPYITAKANVGKLVSYKPAKSDETISGVVKSISLNKTNTIIYYNVQVGTNIKCCTAKNETLEFFDF